MLIGFRTDQPTHCTQCVRAVRSFIPYHLLSRKHLPISDPNRTLDRLALRTCLVMRRALGLPILSYVLSRSIFFAGVGSVSSNDHLLCRCFALYTKPSRNLPEAYLGVVTLEYLGTDLHP